MAKHCKISLYILIIASLYVICNGSLNLELNKSTGQFQLLVNGKKWLHGGDIFMNYAGQKYSVNNGNLIFKGISTEEGKDSLGRWTIEKYTFVPDKFMDIIFNVMFKVYRDHPTLLFGQHVGEEVIGCSVNDSSQVMTGFPSLTVDLSQDLGYLAYGGIMFGDTAKAIGRWQKDTSPIASGLDSGPLILFDENNSAFVMSSFSNFMAGSAVYKSNKGMNTTVTWGLMGMGELIPKDFSYWTILHYSDMGINMAMEGWGDLLKRYYNKDTDFRDSDFVNNYIGYWTDNGAYYYYITEDGKNYQDTILDVYTYAQKMNIPYRYVQYDSWWYPKGDDGGVTEWVAEKSIFPDGLQNLWEKTGWPVVAHNRWWSSETTYAQGNGGKYNFILEKNTTKHAIPTDTAFWNDLLLRSKEWGLLTYEQDWLNTEFDDLDATRKSLTLGRTWLMEMGNGAAKNGLTIQYCMSPSRHALQSLEIPVVTQARGSSDYQPGNDQWKIGVSSIFTHAMAVAPFKDNFWSTTSQTGNLYGKSEPFPQLQSLVATLSTGPVGPSDKINHSDVSLIMKSCNSDGLILKPDRPALAIDKQIKMRAFNGFTGEVWTTYSVISGWLFGIVFGADFGKMDSMTITPLDISKRLQPSKISSAHSPMSWMSFGPNDTVTLKSCSKSQFCLYYTSPVMMAKGKELILLGELDKWVQMSSKRVSRIHTAVDGVAIDLSGASGEVVTFSYMYDGKKYSVPCKMSDAGNDSDTSQSVQGLITNYVTLATFLASQC